MAFKGELLRAWRESNNMTQCAAARKLGITQPFLRNLEIGERQPSTAMLVSILKLTGFSTDDLLGNPTESPSRRGRAKDTQAA